MDELPTLHDLLLRDWGYDLPISGGYGNTRTDPIVINSSDPAAVTRTQSKILAGFGAGRGIYWRRLGREMLGVDHHGIEKLKTQTIQLTADEKITQTEARYFDISALAEEARDQRELGDWLVFPPFRIPSEIGWLSMGEVVNYEAVEPGAGISIGYGAPSIQATLYFYDNQGDVPGDISDPRVRSEFGSAVQQLQSSVADAVPWPDLQPDIRWHRKYFKVGLRAERCTMVALTTSKNKFVKMRVTWDRDEFVDEAAEEWVASVLALVGRGAPLQS